MIMNEREDDFSHSSTLSQEPADRWQIFKRYFCPCLLPKRSPGKVSKRVLDSTSISSKGDKVEGNKREHAQGFPPMLGLKKSSSKPRRISQEEYSKRQVLIEGDLSAFPDKSFRETMHIELSYNNRIRSMQEIDWPVCNYTENYLISLGEPEGQILTKITPLTINTDPEKFKKQMAKRAVRKQKTLPEKYKDFEFNRFWNERYEFFERFDQGIKVQEELWSKIPYESVSEYIASKCNGAKIILDAYAGVGSITIKMASINSCAKVIANEKNKEKLSFLLNNSTIYEVDCFLELSNQEFLKIQRKNIDVVVAHPPFTELQNTAKDIDDIISKSMSLAPNFILLLPPDFSIQGLASSIYRWARKLNWMHDFCSVKIEKVYIKQQLKHILVCAGKLVQTEVKLNDELDYIYGRLKKFGEKFFKHKKIIKKIREDHGMLTLLSLVKLSEKLKKEAFLKNPVSNEGLLTIDFFYELILKKKMVTPQKLQKIKLEQDESVEKAESLLYSGAITDEVYHQSTLPLMEEEKIEENPFPSREPEMTTSEYSYLSYLESIGKKSREPSIKSIISRPVNSSGMDSVSSSGVIIKRVNPNCSKLGAEQVSPLGQIQQQEERAERGNIVELSSKSRVSEMKESLRDDDYHRTKTSNLD